MSERTCTNCRSIVPSGAHFCTTCGTAAPEDAGPDPTTVMNPVPPSWDSSPAPTTAPPAPPAPPAPSAPPAQPAWAQPQAAPPQQPWPQQSAGSQPPTTWPSTQGPGYAQPPSQYPTAGPVGGFQAAPAKKSNVLGALAAFIGAIVTVVGAFTPWVRTTVDAGISGWKASGDAKIVVALGLVALLIGVVILAGVRNVGLRLVLVGLGIATIAIAVVDILSVGNDLPEVFNAQIGIGLILVPIGGVLLLLSGLITRSAK